MRRAAAETGPKDSVEDAKPTPPEATATDTKAAGDAAPSPAPKSAEAIATSASETGAAASFAADLAKEEQKTARAPQIDSSQQKIEPPQASKREAPPGILQQILDSTVGAAQRKVTALPAEMQKSIAESVQGQVDAATGRVKRLPQEALDGVIGFTRDRVSDASSGVQTGVKGALAATVAAPGQFAGQIGSEAQRTAAKAVEVTGGRIVSLPGSLAAATQQRVSALASEAMESTLALPSEFAGTVSRVPTRVQEAVTQAAKDTFDSITGNAKPPPPPPPPPRPLAQRISDFPNEVVASVQSSAEGRIRAVVTDTSSVVGEISSTPAKIGRAVQAGVSSRVQQAGQDTGRLVEEISSSPARLGLAVQAGVTDRIESASRGTNRLVDEIKSAPSAASSSVQRAANNAANSATEQFNKAMEGPVQLGRDIAALPSRTQQRAEELLRGIGLAGK